MKCHAGVNGRDRGGGGPKARPRGDLSDFVAILRLLSNHGSENLIKANAMTKTKKPAAPLRTDVDTAIRCAEAFFQTAMGFVDRMLSSGLRPAAYAIDNLPEMSVSATNMSFAIEVYLKALIAHNDIEYPPMHDLAKLYEKLPKGIQNAVSSAYLARTAALDGAKDVGIVLQIGRGQAPELRTYPRGCLSLLKRSDRMFVTWRYVFAHGDAASAELRFEYTLLRIIAEELRAQLPPTRGLITARNRTSEIPPGVSLSLATPTPQERPHD